MIKENIYVAINRNDEIQWVQGSSKKTRYFKTDRYLKGAVEYHNKYHPDDIWKVRKCVILEDEPQREVYKCPKCGKDTPIEFDECVWCLSPKDEPQTCSVNGRPYTDCSRCEYFRCTADEPRTETSTNNSTISEKLQLKDEQSGKE